MNILLISQCSGNALKETRRILDQFAERRGGRTWQTPITKNGLDTLRRLLRKTARKNTAVACHWIRGIDHSELLWIVGDTKRFNAQGSVPTNITKREILRRDDENDWHTLQDIYLLSSLAALLHDLGKACEAFQKRLVVPSMETNLYRHEWISLRLFQAFVDVDQDEVWLKRLANPSDNDFLSWTNRLQRDGIDATSSNPFTHMSPLAQAIGWLVLSHHRLPVPQSNKHPDGFSPEILNDLPQCITSSWNQFLQETPLSKVKTYWNFKHGLPVVTFAWRNKASQLAKKLLIRQNYQQEDWLSNPYVMHLSRLSLMLADHAYSSLPSNIRFGALDYPIFANTDRHTHKVKQRLDEHLLGVESMNGQVIHLLPRSTKQLPHIVRHKGLRQRSKDEKYRWQDKAAELGEGIRSRSANQGAFIVNMASTGSGKTLANARIMYSLSDPEQGMRCAFALGLRTLTQQTGNEYRERLSLGEDEVAIRIGSMASSDLYKHFRKQAETTGSESIAPLVEEDGHILYEALENYPIFNRVLADPQSRSLIIAPLLICTIDQLIPATESTRGGHQIAPMLRLLSGDLALDELDDYDIDDLNAVSRLIYWAGLLGCRVLISSATLPPALVQGMFDAYREGRTQFQRNRGERSNEVSNICSVWVDEFGCEEYECENVESFSNFHQKFVERRSKNLAKAPIIRRSELIPLRFDSNKSDNIHTVFAQQIIDSSIGLHHLHCNDDPLSNKKVSFGLVRLANINPIFEIALEIYKLSIPKNYRVHLCVYHSQYPLLIRSAIENRLDKALDRHDPGGVFDLHDIRQRIDRNKETNQLFIVLGSPITEVGRDHDYDWAIVEPSSMRSLIQIAGRVHRHRFDVCNNANILVFDHNLKSMTQQNNQPSYWHPGFENKEFSLSKRSLVALLTEQERTIIDSRPRIVARNPQDLDAKNSLVDIEHVRLRKTMLRSPSKTLTDRERRSGVSNTPPLGAYTWWTQPLSMLSGLLQKEQPFRKETLRRVDLVLLPKEEDDDYELAYRLDPKNYKSEYIKVDNSKNYRINIDLHTSNIEPWNDFDYITLLSNLAEQRDLSLSTCAKRFGTISLPESTYGWRSHPILGFTVKN